jgi:hypothetical protein
MDSMWSIWWWTKKLRHSQTSVFEGVFLVSSSSN